MTNITNRMMIMSRYTIGESTQRSAKPFCKCFEGRARCAGPMSNPSGGCTCGEHSDVSEWLWETPTHSEASWVAISPDQKQVTFHPYYSSGTAMVKANTPLAHNYHYYWEVKMLTEPYGTDIMIGVGTVKVDKDTSRFRFTSLLGHDRESYGLSYTGAVRHDDKISRDGPGFCRGTIIGVKVDLWQGTLEFFLNRQSRGVSFYNLRRHPSQTLFPMLSSTAAQSCMRLIYAGSWQASLLVDAAKILGASCHGDLPIPPGMKIRMQNQFWLTLPNDSCINGKRSTETPAEARQRQVDRVEASEFAFTYNEYYTDNVTEDYRIAVIYDDIDMDPNEA